MMTFAQVVKLQKIKYSSKHLKCYSKKLLKMTDSSRCNNRKTESKRINFIVDSINNRTDFGIELINSYKTTFQKDITNAIKAGTNRDHYDIELFHTDGTSIKCEEKGTSTKKLKTFKTPWENSVQRFNGPCNKFSIGLKWAELWYNKVVLDKEIQEMYETGDPPSLQEWLKKDAFACGDPQTTYGVRLKQNYHNHHPKSSMNGKLKSPFDYRTVVNNQFTFTDEDKITLIKEAQDKLNDILTVKENWLQTSGTVETGLTFKWWEKCLIPIIKDVKFSYKEGADIYFHFEVDNPDLNFSSILRFGKGTGFSNIRFDIR